MDDTKESNIYVLLPYLRTSKPVNICGLTFRSIDDVDVLDEEGQKQLGVLSSLFFLRHHSQIRGMVYAHYTIEGPTSPEWFERRLKIAQMFLGFLYSGSGYDGRPFYCMEHVNAFEFTSATVSSFAFRFGEKKLTNDLWPGKEPFLLDNMQRTPGFNVRLNSAVSFPVVSGGRIYPAAPNMWLNHNQDIHSNLISFGAEVVNWALVRFFADPSTGATDFSKRVLSSLEWHNRSTSLNIDEDIALLYLAIALESLLGLDSGEKVTERFKQTLQTLLGPVPRLDLWCYQFYEARSKIVHQGNWPHLNFLLDPKKPVTAHRSLIAYGRVIFRLALTTIVSGAALTHNSKLSSAFATNKERLDNIHKTLNDKAASPIQRIKDVAQSVLELETFFLAEEDVIEAESFASAVKIFAQTYLETSPEAPRDVLEALNSVAGKGETLNFATALDGVRWLAQCVNGWTGGAAMMDSRNEQSRLASIQESAINTLDLFVQMVHLM